MAELIFRHRTFIDRRKDKPPYTGGTVTGRWSGYAGPESVEQCPRMYGYKHEPYPAVRVSAYSRGKSWLDGLVGKEYKVRVICKKDLSGTITGHKADLVIMDEVYHADKKKLESIADMDFTAIEQRVLSWMNNAEIRDILVNGKPLSPIRDEQLWTQKHHLQALLYAQGAKTTAESPREYVGWDLDRIYWTLSQP